MNTQIAGILLAAGGSSRINHPKQLLKIYRKYLINHIVDIIRQGGIDDLTIVLGNQSGKISKVIQDKSAKVMENRKWREGIASSIRKGIGGLDSETKAAIIFVVDQPFLDPKLIRIILNIFNKRYPPIVAPCINGQQCNPVLFSRILFPELLELEGQQGGKEIVKNHTVDWVNWDDQKLLMDIDTIEDYLDIQNYL